MAEDHFGEEIAAGYDASEMFDPSVVDPAVDLLAGLAGDGAALELGVGTGRIAIPLAQRGVPVHGIDLSPAMISQLQRKPAARQIGVTMGDFATTRVAGAFRLVYLVYNGIENLTTQDQQVECFANAARHLEPEGCFVIEVEVPPLQRLPPGETARPFEITSTHLGFDELDVACQRGVSHHYWVASGQLRVFSMPYRYVWPSELDLMARLARLTLRDRWSDWDRTPFTADSRRHVSVWGHAA